MSGLVERGADAARRSQKHRRLKCAIPVEVQGESGLVEARSHDLSASGIFVETPAEHPAGTVLSLRFCLEGQWFSTRAAVVHRRPQHGFGATFLDLTQAERGRILRYVHRERATREARRLLHQAS